MKIVSSLGLLLGFSFCVMVQAAPELPPAEQLAKTPKPDPDTLALALTATVKTPQPPPANWRGWEKFLDDVDNQSDIVIGTGGGRPLHAELALPKVLPPDPMPAIIWIHGGAWQGESQKPNKAAFFATQGFVGVSIEYRLAQEAKWPAQIQDCKLGVRWLRANAAKYHVDPNRIAVWGASAGGHLCSCVGTLDDPSLEGDGGYPGVSSKVQAVIDWFGPVDFSKGGPGVLFNVPFAKDPAPYLQASPQLHIKADQEPFLVMHGDVDYTVPYKASVDFVAAMLKINAPVQFITIHGGMHGFGPPKGFPNPDMSYGQILSRMVEFLDGVFKVQSPIMAGATAAPSP